MKIHFFERDSRKNEPDFEETCGSFSVIQNILRKGLRELGVYTENPDEADYVGVADCLDLGFRYKDKKSFIIAFIDNCNTIADIQYNLYQQNKPLLFSINYHTADIYGKYGIPCKVIGAGIDWDYWYPSVKKDDSVFKFFSNTFSNYRSGLDLLIPAFTIAFKNKSDVKLTIKDTSNSKQFINAIEHYRRMGARIEYISKRITFSEMRDLYSRSHVFCNVFRHSGHGIGMAEAGLCKCSVIAGDFNPSNRITMHGTLLKPIGEVEVNKILPDLVNNWGLTDTFGKFTHPEEPRIYDYSIEDYADLLIYAYKNYDRKPSLYDNFGIITRDWDYKKSAQKLLNYLNEQRN